MDPLNLKPSQSSTYPSGRLSFPFRPRQDFVAGDRVRVKDLKDPLGEEAKTV